MGRGRMVSRGFRVPPRDRLSHRPIQFGLGSHTPSRTFSRAYRNVSERLVILPIDGESAAPDTAIAAVSVKSRPLTFPRTFSYGAVGNRPITGPPTSRARKVKV